MSRTVRARHARSGQSRVGDTRQSALGTTPAEGLLQIGEAAERLGLSLRTVRYWEEVGLVMPSGRTNGGFRLYSEDDLKRLLVVKRMKPLGLTLDEMRELLQVLEQTAHPKRLDSSDLRRAIDGLSAYAERSEQRVEKLLRYLDEARRLQLQIIEHLARCESIVEAAPGAAIPPTGSSEPSSVDPPLDG